MQEREIAPLPEEHTAIHDVSWRDRAKQAGGLLAATTCLVGGSAAIGAYTPATAEIAPGITVDAALQNGHTSLDLGALGSIDLPKVTYHTPVGPIGADLVVHGIAVDFKNPETLNSYAALKNDPRDSVSKPIVDAIKHNAMVGAGIGLGIETAAAGLLYAYQRRKKQRSSNDTTTQQRVHDSLGRLAELTADNNEAQALIAQTRASLVPNPAERSVTVRHKATATVMAAGMLLALACDTPHHPSTELSAGIPLNSVLTANYPILTGATVSGNGAEWLINSGTAQVMNYIASADAFYEKVNKNIVAAFAKHQSRKGDIALGDPRYVTVLAISDYHCNLAMLKKSFRLIANIGHVTVVANMGDTSISTGRLPSEKQCTDAMGEALQPNNPVDHITPIVTVEGNHDGTIIAKNERNLTLHDGAKTYRPFVVLDDKQPTAKVNGLVFTSGANDPRQSIFGHPLTPQDPEEQNKALYKQGHVIAKNACAAQQRYGEPPIVLAHGAEATYESIVKNCVSVAMSGHLHVQHGPFAYTLPPEPNSTNSESAPIYSFVQGSSSGAGPNELTEYSPVTAKAGAPYTYFLFDPATNKPIGYYNLSIDTKARVKLSSFKRMPKANGLPSDIPLFVSRYQN